MISNQPDSNHSCLGTAGEKYHNDSKRRGRYQARHRLVGLVVKASASGAEDPGFESRLREIFPGPSHTSDFKIGTPVATLPGAWRYRVSAWTGRPCVSILWVGELEWLGRRVV